MRLIASGYKQVVHIRMPNSLYALSNHVRLITRVYGTGICCRIHASPQKVCNEKEMEMGEKMMCT